MFRTAVVCIALLAAACTVDRGDLPEIVVDRSACSHCGMLISEPRFAAASRTRGGDAKVFDDIGCLLSAAAKDPDASTRYWFHDATDGTWIDRGDVVFVSSPTIRTPMGGGILAYREAAAADQAAAKHGGRVVRSISELMALKEGHP